VYTDDKILVTTAENYNNKNNNYYIGNSRAASEDGICIVDIIM